MLPLVALLLAAAPPPQAKGPPPSDLAQLYFLAGDIRRAVETAQLGMRVEPAKCKAMYPLLVEYEFLIQKSDRLTPEEAKQVLEYDKKISPKAVGKLTGPVITRHIVDPLRAARTAAGGGDTEKARKLLQQILVVDPKHADSLALLDSLPKAADAGR